MGVKITNHEINLSTPREDFYNITSQVKQAISESGVKNGTAIIFCPHTTAGITINENADPDVIPDMLIGLAKAYPDRAEFRHAEGNSAAHLKATDGRFTKFFPFARSEKKV